MEPKIVVSASAAEYLLNALRADKKALEEKILALDIQIESVENSLKNPVEKMVKKETEYTLTSRKVEVMVSKFSGSSVDDLADLFTIDLNLSDDPEVRKILKGRIYQHLHSLKNRGRVSREFDTSNAADVYFPLPVEAEVAA